MKPGYLLIPAIALAILAVPLIAAEIDAESEPIVFTDGLFTFQTIEGERVAAIEYDNENAEEVVEIPEWVEHDGVEYIVTDLMCSFTSDRIIGVKIPRYVWNIPYPSLIRAGNNIEAYIVHDDNYNLISDDGVLYDKKMERLIAFPKGHELVWAFQVPNTVRIIGEYAFAGCNNVQYVNTYQEGLTEIRTGAFEGCESLMYINNVGDLNYMPDTLTIIDNGAFKDCVNIGSFVFPENLKIIGESAFENTAITSVRIPSQLVYLGDCAFGNCGNLTEITSDYNVRYTVENGVLFDLGKDAKTLMTYPAGKTGAEYTIDDEVTSIADMAFAGTKYLKKVNLSMGAMMIPAGSFADCTSLEEIDLSRIVLIDASAFWNCVNLRTVTFGDTLATINSSAFENCGLEEVVLPPSVNYIGPYAFCDCKNLKKFTISDYSTAEVYLGAWNGCLNLEEIDLLSSDIRLEEGALNIADEQPIDVTVVKPKGYVIPSDAVTDGLTTLTLRDIGERPYPLENLVGVAICILILAMIVRLFRKV